MDWELHYLPGLRMERVLKYSRLVRRSRFWRSASTLLDRARKRGENLVGACDIRNAARGLALSEDEDPRCTL
jgi:hypothetical protein